MAGKKNLVTRKRRKPERKMILAAVPAVLTQVLTEGPKEVIVEIERKRRTRRIRRIRETRTKEEAGEVEMMMMMGMTVAAVAAVKVKMTAL